MTGPRQLKLGVIGLGSTWEATVRPALVSLAPRILILAVQDACPQVLTEHARALVSRPHSGVRSLLAEDLDGVIVTAASWLGDFPLRETIRLGNAVHAPIPQTTDVATLAAWHQAAADRQVTIHPELRLRYSPATLRLRELLATELGQVQTLKIRARSPGVTALPRVEMELVDWCQSILGGVPRGVESTVSAGPRNQPWRQTRIDYRLQRAGDHGFAVTMELPESRTGEAEQEAASLPPSDEWPLEFSLQCRFGEARLEDAVHLRWRSCGQERVESLSMERTAVAVSLDHFARRLAGGLIPVPNLGDVVTAYRLVKVIEDSLNRRGRVALDTPAPG